MQACAPLQPSLRVLWHTLIISLVLFALFIPAAYAADRPATIDTASARKSTNAPEPSLQAMSQKLGTQRPVFIENMGQFDPKVKFQVKIGTQAVWLTSAGFVFDATRPAAAEKAVSAGPKTSDSMNYQEAPPPFVLKGAKPESRTIDRLVFSEDFVGASCCSKVEGKNPQPGVYNYFQGGDPKEWRTNVHGYAEVIYHNVWPGIDLRIFANGPDVEQEFILQPGADLTTVRMTYGGIDKLGISPDGSLEIDTAFGTLLETKPRLYQQIAGTHVPVDGRFKLISSNSYTFEIGAIESGYALVIDPTLLYSTFLGGSNVNTIYGMAVDSSGSTYVAGVTASQDFPVTYGTLQSGYNLFVTKLNAAGSSLVYSSILGRGFPLFYNGGVALDSQGNAYMTGYGFNMPTTANAYSSCSSSIDGFLTVLAPAGNQLVYSTCLHSATPFPSANAGVWLAVDSGGRAFIAGQTGCGLATTPNAFQPNCPSSNSGFLRVLDPTLSGNASLTYSSYLGDPSQSLNTFVGGIALDSFGKAYVTGQVYSSTSNSGQFPTTPGAFRTTLAACTPTASGPNQSYCQWPYVAKFDTTAQGLNSLIYSTYIGYAGQSTMTADGIPLTMPLNMGIIVDGSGNAYITGGAGSGYLTTPGAYQTTGPGTFVTKLNAGGSDLVWSTFLPTTTYPSGGGTPSYTSPFHLYPPTIGFPIAVDVLGQAYISGNTPASNYPVTSDAFQSTLADNFILGGGGDAFLTILNSAGSGLVYSSYLGGGRSRTGHSDRCGPNRGRLRSGPNGVCRLPCHS